jgi:hypothetical protein
MRKTILGLLVCTLLISIAVLPIAVTREEEEYKENVNPEGNQLYWYWRFHPKKVNGLLGVFATYNCQKIYPCLWHGYVKKCTTYYGRIPSTHSGHPVNDIMFEFIWDWCCFNKDRWKFAVPYYDYPYWRLLPIVEWYHENVDLSLSFVSLGDDTGEISDVYVMVDGNVALEEPPIIQDEYMILDGTCDELPGYLIGTTPIVFNPQAEPYDYPFETTPLTGVLQLDGEMEHMREENLPPTAPEINGPTSGNAGTEVCWTFHSDDPNGDQIRYIINWGDGTTTETDCVEPCTPYEVCHTYENQGDWVITAYAQECPAGLESEVSTFRYTSPKNTIAANSMFLRLLERFPNACTKLRYILGF